MICPPAGIPTRGKALTCELTEISPITSQAIPPSRASRAARYQIRPGRILVLGAANEAASGPRRPGTGAVGVSILPSLLKTHRQDSNRHRTVISDIYTPTLERMRPRPRPRAHDAPSRNTIRPEAAQLKCWPRLFPRVAGGLGGGPNVTGRIAWGRPLGGGQREASCHSISMGGA